MPDYCLSLHGSYGCRNTGACCSRWDVPADPHVVEVVSAGVVRRSSPVSPWLWRGDGTGSGGLRIARTPDGSCVFRERSRCAIHRDAGVMALPVSCRHFPRVMLRDRRGTFISLSHYCPTAASLLFTGGAPDVAPAGGSLPVEEPVEGLDARSELPPLLRPGLLSDLDAYDLWERSVIGTFARTARADRALDVIAAATEGVRAWKPGNGSLGATVDDAFSAASHDPGKPCRRREEFDIVTGLPGGGSAPARPRDLERVWDELAPPARVDLHRPIANYLAARAFGNWIAYQGHGLRTIVSWLRACHDILRSVAASQSPSGAPLTRAALLESIRFTDLFMLHTIDSHAFAREAAAFEKGRGA